MEHTHGEKRFRNSVHRGEIETDNLETGVYCKTKREAEIKEDRAQESHDVKAEYKGVLESFRDFTQQTTLHGIRFTCDPSTGKFKRYINSIGQY